MRLKITINGTIAKSTEMIPENKEDEKFLEILKQGKHVVDVFINQKDRPEVTIVTLVSV